MIPDVEPLVLAGGIARLGAEGPESGIAKRPVRGPWRITRTGLDGDAQADLKNHGGPEKALHQYPREHYAAWSKDLDAHPLLTAPGAFGENLSSIGWTEQTVCIGDIVRFGSSLLQVSQGRQPCFKLDLRFGREGVARAVQTSGRTGWYWRVLEQGEANEGDAMRLIDRPQPAWPLARLVTLLYRDTRNREDMTAMAALPELAEGWRKLAQRRLATGRIEDWTKRLTE
jgi:MOSC domain-containing protein YiiM